MNDYYPAWRSAHGGDDYATWLWGRWRRAEPAEADRIKKLYLAEEARLKRQ